MTETTRLFTVYGIKWTIKKGCPIEDGECTSPTLLDKDFRWDTVQIGYNAFGDNNERMNNYKIEGRLYEGDMDENGNINVINYLDKEPVSYSIEIDHPENYGVELFSNSDGCGIVDGSTYDYIMVFDQTDFAYLPFNSGNTKDEFIGELKIKNKFPLEPEYPDIKDPAGRATPIYPMDMVSRFAPDPRESVTLTYKVKGTNNKYNIRNSDITITHTVVQEVEDYGKQLKELMSHTMLGNQQELDYSPNYPYNYPYTLVSNEEPTVRGSDRNNSSLQRGDVWFNPITIERKQWSVSDVPETLTLIKKGKNYRKTTNVPCIWQPKDYCVETKDRKIPYGLFVDLVLENGSVSSVVISGDSLPNGFQDGDEVSIQGGDNQAMIRISIQSSPGWVDTYIE